MNRSFSAFQHNGRVLLVAKDITAPRKMWAYNEHHELLQPGASLHEVAEAMARALQASGGPLPEPDWSKDDLKGHARQLGFKSGRQLKREAKLVGVWLEQHPDGRWSGSAAPTFYEKGGTLALPALRIENASLEDAAAVVMRAFDACS